MLIESRRQLLCGAKPESTALLLQGMDLPSMLSSWDVNATTVLIVTFFVVYLLSASFRRRAYPPGPPAWPIVGHLPKIVSGKSRLKFINDVAAKYGPVTTIWAGSRPMVVLNTLEAIKEAFVKRGDLFESRPFPPVTQLILGGKPVGIIFNNGESHRAMRRVTLTALHEFGLGKQSLEEKIQEEFCALSDELQKSRGEPLHNIKRAVQQAVSNVIINICFGSRLHYDDKEFQDLMDQLDTFFQNGPHFQPENTFPFLLRLRRSKAIREVLGAQESFKAYVSKQIESHKSTFDRDNVRDMVDLYLKAAEEKDEYFNAENLLRVIIDMFGAGSETTSTALAWALLFLIKDTQIQAKAQQEIMKELGKHKMPTIKDSDRLVYVNAILHEVQRFASVAPIGVFRFLSEDVRISGVDIPKGCIVVPNIYRVHMDKSYWKDPEVFRPERWINEKGLLIKHSHYLPFSIGKRACLGENFSKIEAFIALTMLLQRFTFSLPKGASTPSTDGIVGVTRAPEPFDICMLPL